MSIHYPPFLCAVLGLWVYTYALADAPLLTRAYQATPNPHHTLFTKPTLGFPSPLIARGIATPRTLPQLKQMLVLNPLQGPSIGATLLVLRMNNAQNAQLIISDTVIPGTYRPAAQLGWDNIFQGQWEGQVLEIYLRATAHGLEGQYTHGLQQGRIQSRLQP